MRNGILSFFAVSVCLAVSAGANAQSKSGATARRVADKPAVSVVKPAVIDVKTTFSLSTPSENWSLDDPMPVGQVQFGTQRLSLDDRMINSSLTPDGENQLLFPVSWFEPYGSADPILKYVVVKYKNGKATSIMAEYVEGRFSMPRESFQAHPDGHSFYADVAVHRQDGQVYLKQMTSKGKEDGRGGLYVDMVMIYRVVDTTPVVPEKPATTKKTRP
ncbi:MAG: hypothetical protein IT175_19000 [Acidobacteria bacterium]|nr:hypothetical protein [Acidobacteriota bacterium]